MNNCEWLKVSKHTTYAAVVKRHNNSIKYAYYWYGFNYLIVQPTRIEMY